tara:strand:- start:218 stop:457 length:240 start_codon:yes stop_codon:yes gene_type:complete
MAVCLFFAVMTPRNEQAFNSDRRFPQVSLHAPSFHFRTAASSRTETLKPVLPQKSAAQTLRQKNKQWARTFVAEFVFAA